MSSHSGAYDDLEAKTFKDALNQRREQNLIQLQRASRKLELRSQEQVVRKQAAAYARILSPQLGRTPGRW